MQEICQSEIDFHFFIHPDRANCNHVDDSVLIGHDRSKIEAMIADLSTKMDQIYLGDLAAFLASKSSSLLSMITCHWLRKVF